MQTHAYYAAANRIQSTDARGIAVGYTEDARNRLTSIDYTGRALMDLSLNIKGVVAQQLIPTPDGKGRRVTMEVLHWLATGAGLTSATARSTGSRT